jgi:hypothetical protein
LKFRQLGKLCPLKRWTTFILADFEVHRWNLENSAKVLRGFKNIRYLTWIWPCLDRDLTTSECWLG